MEADIGTGQSLNVPSALDGNKHAAAYYGVLKQVADSADINENQITDLSIQVDQIVSQAVAEHSLSPENIEAAIRKNSLPILFKGIGLDQAKQAVEKLIEITRLGLARGTR